MKTRETHARSIVKAIIWRIIATIGTWLMIYLFTKDAWGSLSGTLAAALLGTIGYYINERVWNQIHWGRHHR